MHLIAEKCLSRRFLGNQNGATAIEYALIAGGVSVAIIAGVQAVGTTVTANFYTALLNLF